ncbi:MAG: peptidoglycan DD-metalloendopeptidase family protein [Clostridia bacterium]|nr:peptidoglycan DD-metalloendopeptidase family protein [Clostridia bacterium]
MSQKQADNKPISHIGGAVKKFAGVLVSAALCAAVAIYITMVCSYDIAVRVNINGAPVGYVESQDDIAGVKTQLLAIVEEATEGQYIPKLDVSYDFVHTNDADYLTASEYGELLWSQIEDDFCMAYMLYVDDHQTAACMDGEALHELISDIEAELLASGGASFEEVRVTNELRIENQLCLKAMVRSIEEINSLINPLAEVEAAAEPDADEASDVDSIMRISAFTAAAPGSADSAAYIDPNVDYGLNREREQAYDPVLDYNFVNTVTVNEVISFKTQYIDDFDNFIGNEKVTCEGVDGEKTVTYEIIYDADGSIVARNAISESIITPAVDKIVMVGAVEIPDAVPTGTFIWPCEAPKGVSSYYGWRDLYGKRDFHLGIDIPDDLGSSIWASDGGTVTWAGTTPSYGKSVRIAHANGYSTLYAHLNEILVEVGDEVYQKQTIGTMGKTGVAYGVHLHFEVRINDVTVNPMKYLPKAD